MLRKGVQAAVGKQLNGKGDLLRFGFLLFQEFISEILQGRHFALIIILLIGAVNRSGTTVDNGFLLCTEVRPADKLFAKRHNKLGFENNRVRPIAVFLCHIHSVDMVLRSGGDVDYFTAERLDKRRIFPLRINYNHI